MIAANLPYVTSEQWEAMPPEIREWEPREALDGGADGLDHVRRLLAQAPARLAAGGALFCEIGDWQGAEARGLAEAAFAGADVGVRRDLAGRERVLCVRRPV
jgi:release factor glutamine methyltransferase